MTRNGAARSPLPTKDRADIEDAATAKQQKSSVNGSDRATARASLPNAVQRITEHRGDAHAVHVLADTATGLHDTVNSGQLDQASTLVVLAVAAEAAGVARSTTGNAITAALWGVR